MKRTKKEFVLALSLFAFCFILQNTAIIVEKILAPNIKWDKKGPILSANIASLPNGYYYASLGKPRGHCNILIDNQTVFIGKGGVPDKRMSLLVGASFEKSDKTSQIQIDCLKEMSGFKLYLAHSPVIAPYQQGMFIHLTRAISEIVVGPFASLVLILMLLYAQLTVGVNIKFKEWGFALVAFVYSLSLAYITRLFMNGSSASLAHILLRFSFSYSAYLILNEGLTNRKSVLWHHLVVAIGAIVLATNQNLHYFYSLAHPTLLIPFCLSFYDRQRSGMASRKHLYFAIFTLGWIFAQSLDAINVWLNFGVYNSPMLIMVLSLTYGIMVLENHRTSRKLQLLQERLNSMFRDKTEITSFISGIRDILSYDSNLPSITAYVDGYLVGKVDVEGVVLCPVVGDSTYDIHRGDLRYGQVMSRALDVGEVIIQKGTRDQNWFVVAPITKYCCINFTTSEKVTDYLAYETYDLVSAIRPWLESALGKIIELAHRQNGSLQKLRTITGNGSFERITGAVFADIADYSKYTEIHGNAYAAFISTSYFPTMIRSLAPWATPEAVRGDEVYFVVVSELSEVLSFDQQLVETLRNLIQFTQNEGKQLCISNGYPNVEMRVGATCGDATIVVDDIQVRTSGDHINRAKRLQDAAAKNEVWVESSLINSTFLSNLVPLKRKIITVKKNTIEAVKVGVKRAA